MHEIDVEAVYEIAARAGREIMNHFVPAGTDKPSTVGVSLKGDNTPVTQADLSASKIIREQLSLLGGGYPVVCEESALPDYKVRRDWSCYWLVDPLDGTKEFVAGRDQFTVNIALVQGGTSVFGVVLAPASCVGYIGVSPKVKASRKVGSYEYRGGEVTPISCDTQVSNTCRLLVSRDHHDPESIGTLFDDFADTECLPMGSSLKMCEIAAGRADAYVRMGPTCEWDTAAAQVVLEQAGGALVDFNKAPLRYNKPVIFNPEFIALRKSLVSRVRWP